MGAWARFWSGLLLCSAAEAFRIMPVMSVDTSQFVGLPGCPRLGLGLAALGRPGSINLQRDSEVGGKDTRSVDAMREQSFKVMDAAWANGIRYFDAARSYGRSEEFLNAWLQSRGIRPDQVAVGSKWGYRYTADWRIDTGGEPHEVKDHSAAHFSSQHLETLDLLGDHLRLYQIHSATLESGVLDDAKVLNALREFKNKRLVRLGLSLSGVMQSVTLQKALEIPLDPAASSGARLFDCVQATFNCAEQSAGPALLQAREAGMDVIVKEAMANGRLLKGAPAARVKAAADKLGVAPDALCLAAVMVQGFRPMVLSGAATPEQVESNAAALALADKVLRGEMESARAEIEALMDDTRVEPDAYWTERSQLVWN